jgi:hypothetical protein
LEEEKATLEGMVESRDELLMEIARETELDRMVRMLMMEEMPPHPLPLHHHLRQPLLPCLKRSTKRAL